MASAILGRPWASAAHPVARELGYRFIVDRLEMNALTLEPDAKVRDRVQMEPGRDLVVARLGELPLILTEAL
jgi:hypothetical protein